CCRSSRSTVTRAMRSPFALRGRVPRTRWRPWSGWWTPDWARKARDEHQAHGAARGTGRRGRSRLRGDPPDPPGGRPAEGADRDRRGGDGSPAPGPRRGRGTAAGALPYRRGDGGGGGGRDLRGPRGVRGRSRAGPAGRRGDRRGRLRGAGRGGGVRDVPRA